MFGRLGTGKEADELKPVEVKFENSESQETKIKFVGVAAGAYHSLALAGFLLSLVFRTLFFPAQTFPHLSR